MYSITFFIGIFGSLILVVGAALPDPKQLKHPAKSLKNWFFVFGSLMMFVYAFLIYQAGGSFFFVILQMFIIFAQTLMMLNIKERIAIPLLSIAIIMLVVWSLFLFAGFYTIFFVLGLSILGMGYALKSGTCHRNVALTLGSCLIAFFSYLESDWIFFGLNLIFALFSGFYMIRSIKKN